MYIVNMPQLLSKGGTPGLATTALSTYAEVVLNSVGTGSSPESEEVISGDFLRTPLPIANLIDEARDDVKVSGHLLESPNFLH